MPVELSDLLSNKRWVEVPVGEHVMRVAYKPGTTSLRRQAQLQRQMRELQAAEDTDEESMVENVAQVFCEIVCDWDLTENGRPLPVNVVTVGNLPGIVYNAIMDAINADGGSSAEEKKAQKVTSAAGSAQEGKSVPVLNGLPSSEMRGTWA